MTKKPSSQSEHIRLAVLGIGGAAAAFVLFGGLGTLGKGGSGEPFDAMPKSSFLVATVNVDELRRSPVYEAVLGKGEDGSPSRAADPIRGALGMTSLADACGFDPLGRVRRLAVSVPEEGERGEFGLAARVEVTREELEKCTRALAERRGGDDKVATREVGSFVVVDGVSSPGSGPGASRSSSSQIGYGRAGLLVVGKGAWFSSMLGAADGKAPGAREAVEHASLRSALTSKEGFRAPTLLVTAILPRSLRDRLRGEMTEGGSDSANATMSGVLGVSAIGAALQAGSATQSADAAVEMLCDTPAGCEAVEKLILKKRLEWSRDLTLRMLGLGPLVDSLEVKRDGSHLRATASANAVALASTVDRLLRLRAKPAPPPPRPSSAPPPPPPDELLPGKPR